MDYQAAGFRLSAGSLLSFHAEHRPALARLPILVDMWIAGGRGWVPFVLILGYANRSRLAVVADRVETVVV